MDSPTTPARQEYYERIGRDDLAPLWEVLKHIVPREPRSFARARLWRWHEVKPLLLEAGRVISAEEAERRVLGLENPAYRGQSRATPTLYAGLQLILPGEVARAHRHVAGAIRFILEGTGAYTAVDGERTAMHPGDFVITPSWTWHDHGHTGEEPVIWLDGLDLPIVNFFEAAFLEHHAEEIYPQKKPQDDSLGRYAHPRTGGWPTPTMGGTLSLLPKGFAGEAARQTDGQIVVCVEGRGRTEIGGQWFDWGPKDVFVVPNWTRFRHEAAEEAVLFTLSDRPAQERLNIWREGRD